MATTSKEGSRRNGFDGDVVARGLRAEALHLVKSGKPIDANDYPLAQAA